MVSGTELAEMTDRDEVRRLAEAHAAYYNDHSNTSMAEFAEKYWAPDIEMYTGGRGAPHGIQDMLKGHDPEKGFDWSQTRMDVKKVVVGDDAFVLQMEIAQWRSHEADAVAAGIDGVDGADSLDYQSNAVPVIILYHVSDGLVVRSDSYLLFSFTGLPATSLGGSLSGSSS
jgi:hypothetical protein